MRYLIVVDMQKDFVDTSCCAGVTPESYLRALESMKTCQIQITNEE